MKLSRFSHFCKRLTWTVTVTNRWIFLWNWLPVWFSDLALVCWVWTPGFFLASCRFLLVSLSDRETRTKTTGQEGIGENSSALSPQSTSKSEHRQLRTKRPFLLVCLHSHHSPATQPFPRRGVPAGTLSGKGARQSCAKASEQLWAAGRRWHSWLPAGGSGLGRRGSPAAPHDWRAKAAGGRRNGSTLERLFISNKSRLWQCFQQAKAASTWQQSNL